MISELKREELSVVGGGGIIGWCFAFDFLTGFVKRVNHGKEGIGEALNDAALSALDSLGSAGGIVLTVLLLPELIAWAAAKR